MNHNKYIETEEKFMTKDEQEIEWKKGWDQSKIDFENKKYKRLINKNIFYENGYACGWEFLSASEAIK